MRINILQKEQMISTLSKLLYQQDNFADELIDTIYEVILVAQNAASFDKTYTGMIINKYLTSIFSRMLNLISLLLP